MFIHKVSSLKKGTSQIFVSCMILLEVQFISLEDLPDHGITGGKKIRKF